MNSEWQKESTAPVYQWVLVCYSDHCGLNVQIAKKTNDGWISPAFATVEKNRIHVVDTPTHWMYLPEAADTKFDNSDDFLIEIVNQWNDLNVDNTGGKAEIFARLMDLASDFVEEVLLNAEEED